MKCKVCQQEKTKTPVIRNNITRFVDENNRLWNGSQCADCYKEYNKNRMRVTRKQKQIETNPQQS